MIIVSKIRDEVEQYRDHTVQIGEHDTHYSQYKLVKRIRLFQNRVYPSGKVSKDGEYKYWYDIIMPRVNSEVKNLRFESRNILPFSTNPIGDFAPVFILNARNVEWMRDTGREEEIHESVEMFSGLGNLLWKRVSGGYELFDPENTYITNQAAKTVDETAIIQRAELTQSQLREKAGVWKNVEEVIDNCGKKQRSKTKDGVPQDSKSPLYEIYERNGEISEKELFEAQGKEGGDDKKYVLARVIAAWDAENSTAKKFVLFAEAFPAGKKMSDMFIEAHRGPYKGKWWREGMYELLFDYQYRANEIGIQIARGLEWASKVIFKDDTPQFFNNIRTQLKNGRVVKSSSLSQVEVRLQGLDQLIADWNRLLADADKVANSFEVVSGESLPSGTPFRMGQLLDVNANKLFIHLRSKFGSPYARVYRDFVLTEFIKDLKGEDIIRVTGDADMLRRFRETAVNSWYTQNLAKIGPHTKEQADELKKMKLAEMEELEPIIKNNKEIWKGLLPRLHVTITGENYSETENLQTIASVLQFEQDPKRRAFLLDTVYAAKGIPVPPPMEQAPVEQQAPSQIKKEDKEAIAGNV